MHIKHAHKDIVAVKGIKNVKQTPVLGSNDSCPSVTPTTSTTPVDITSKADTNPNIPKSASTSTSLDAEVSGYHKRCPKPMCKHNWPKLTPTPPPHLDETKLPQKTPKLEFVMVTHGLKKVKKIRWFRCKICSVVTESQAMANSHYRSNHPPIKCPDCDFVFNNPNSLRHHKYTHITMKYPCRTCGKVLKFKIP